MWSGSRRLHSKSSHLPRELLDLAARCKPVPVNRRQEIRGPVPIIRGKQPDPRAKPFLTAYGRFPLATSTAYTWALPCMFAWKTIHLPSGVKLTFGSRR